MLLTSYRPISSLARCGYRLVRPTSAVWVKEQLAGERRLRYAAFAAALSKHFNLTVPTYRAARCFRCEIAPTPPGLLPGAVTAQPCSPGYSSPDSVVAVFSFVVVLRSLVPAAAKVRRIEKSALQITGEAIDDTRAKLALAFKFVRQCGEKIRCGLAAPAAGRRSAPVQAPHRRTRSCRHPDTAETLTNSTRMLLVSVPHFGRAGVAPSFPARFFMARPCARLRPARTQRPDSDEISKRQGAASVAAATRRCGFVWHHRARPTRRRCPRSNTAAIAKT